MTQEEYNSIDWNRGNTVRLTNGKEYSVRGHKKTRLVLYSTEYEKHFIADCRIIECRTGDAIEPYVPKEKPAENAAPAPKAEAKAKPEPVVEKAPEPAPVAEPAPEPAAEAKPKRKRMRISVTKSEKVQY